MAATSVGNLRINLTAFTGKFTTSMKKAGLTVGKFSSQITAANASMKTAGTATAVLSGIVTKAGIAMAAAWTLALGPLGKLLAAITLLGKTFGSAEGFTANLQESLAIMGDVSDKMRERMVKAAQEVAETTKFSMGEAAKAYFFLASAGLDVEQQIAALPAVARFAQAGMFDLSRATELATGAQSAIGLASKDAQKNLIGLVRVTDVLVKGNKLAKATVEQFSEALTNKAGAALRFLNKDIEEGVAILAAFADQNVKGSEAGTALDIVLRELTIKAAENADAWKEAGIAVFDTTGNMRNTADVIADLEKKLKGMNDVTKIQTLLQLGLQAKSISYIKTLIGMSDGIRDYEQILRGVGGTTEEVAEKQFTAWSRAFNKFKAILERFAIEVGAPLIVILSDMLAEMTAILRTLGPLITGLGQLITQWKKLQDLIPRGPEGGAIGKVFDALKVSVKATLNPLGSALDAIEKFRNATPSAIATKADGTLGIFDAVKGRMEELQKEARKTTEAVNNIFQGGMANAAGIFATAGTSIATQQIKEMKRLQELGKSIFDQTRTARERHDRQVQDLFQLRNLGIIGSDTLTRGLQAARRDLLDTAVPITGGGPQPALAKFSREAHSAIVGSQDAPALKEAREQTKLLEQIRDRVEPLDVVEL